MRDLGILLAALALCAEVPAGEPVDIGARRELFVDDALIERLAGQAELRLHRPAPCEVSIVAGEPWEGNGCGYMTVFRDGDRYRMYYRGLHGVYSRESYREAHREVSCYAESADGIRWAKPELGLFEFEGSKKNNIVWDGVGTHAFVPFKDASPGCPDEARYKALGVGGGGKQGLYAFRSPDGIHWSLLRPDPVVTKGAFDSQNLAFWDSIRGEYREYHRDFRDGRDIRTSTSKDFLSWPEPAFVEYAAWPKGEGQIPDLEVARQPPGRPGQLYTNQVLPYYRAPHIFLGFPTRYLDRGWTESTRSLPRHEYRQVRAAQSRREGTAITEGLLMASRDGQRFKVWADAFLRPGLRTRDGWFYGDNYQALGLVETKSSLEDGPPEISIYVSERTAQEQGTVFRRHSLRIDGFASCHASLAGGEAVTQPLVFRGRRLSINFSTSAAGGIRVEIQDAGGQPLSGFALADCPEVFGDALERAVGWQGGSDLSAIAGKPVRLRFVLRDADLFAFQFTD